MYAQRSENLYSVGVSWVMEETLPSKEEAEKLLLWAHSQNPGPWAKHSQVVARIAETIAKQCGLDCHRAYTSGLLHDIGRYEGVRGLHHSYAGYDIMLRKGYPQIADICLSHSFPYKNLDANNSACDCTPDELSVIASFLANKTFDDYDKLIQLGDAMGAAQGVCLIEVRLVDIVRRYGFNDFTLRKWDCIFELKSYFDKLCKTNVYDYFYDEISATCLRG